MNLSERDFLRRLGAGEPLADLCAAAGLTPEKFGPWWRQQLGRRVPPDIARRRGGVRSGVRIHRDRWGVPHIHAANDEDLFFGFGYAMAQDRLFQLDFLRRKGAGRLAEVLGEGGGLDFLVRMVGVPTVLDWDRLARTVGIRRIPEAEWGTLSGETRSLLSSFSGGINAWIEEVGDRLPIEFALLDYQPEPWSPVDCLTIEVDFRWYLTGRFPVIVMPELVRRALGDGPLLRAFLQSEADEASILRRGEYPTGLRRQSMGGGGDGSGEGSNNWVVAGSRARSGKPLVASDPHVPFDVVSWWYEVLLCGGSFHVAGIAYPGMPAVMFGRTESVAWGCTNNICSQRDLYQEKPGGPDGTSFLFDGRWEPASERQEEIAIRGKSPVRFTVRSSRNGPLVDAVLPPAARQTDPVSLKWLGADQGGWLTALLAMNRARSSAELREATRPWHVPTFSLVFADVEGHIGYQAVGRIPLRGMAARGYRPGWDPAHQWQGLIPFEGMPNAQDPARGWVATANNRPAPDDFPYPLSGTWSDGSRAARIQQMLENATGLDADQFVRMHQDALSLRAVRGLPGLLKALAGSSDARMPAVIEHLGGWDCRMETDRIGATIFDVFFARWVKRVIQERFEGDAAGLLAGGANGLAAALLHEDPAGWFHRSDRLEAIWHTMSEMLDHLERRLGADAGEWQWGRLHMLPLRHSLSGRGDLGKLLDAAGGPVKGNFGTVCNTGSGARMEVRTGSTYRLIADLAGPVLLAVDAESQSGQPGSPHYADQLQSWLAGQYKQLRLERPAHPPEGKGTFLEPG
jgi:penicillin amidase